MALQFAVVILDLTSAFPAERQQDLAKIAGVDMIGSKFNPNTSPKSSASHLRLSFPIATPDLFITELMEVWSGWRDDTTDEWSDVDPNGDPYPVFGGYITRIESETVYGGEKIFECTVSDYTFLLKKTDVKGWPTFINHIPVANTGGMIGGTSVQDWLVGDATAGAPYDGVVRKNLGNGMRYDGVDPMFATISIEDDTLPGFLDVVPSSGAIKGYFGGGGTTVESIVQVIADCCVFTYYKNYVGPELVVSYWVEAAIGADSTRIVPRFRFANTADLVGTPDFVVATDADESIGEVPMLHPHKHERDASDVRTGIVVFGEGGDLTQIQPLPLVWGEYQNPSHQQVYPTAYQTENPWWGGGPLFDKRIHTVLTAQSLAQFIESRVWGAKGSIEFYIRHPVTAGQRIQVRDTNEAIDRVYMVTEAEGPDETGKFRVRVGFTQPTMDDVMRGGLADVILVQEDLFFNVNQGLRARSFWPGQSRSYPLEAQPQHIQQNWITPASRAVPGLTVQGTIFAPLIEPSGPSEEVEVGAPNADLIRALSPQNNVGTPPVLFPNPTFWVDHKTARPHPNCIHAGGYTVNGTYPLTIAVYPLHITAVDLKGPGMVSLYKNGPPTAGGTLVWGPYSESTTMHYTNANFWLYPADPAAVPQVHADDLYLVITAADPVLATFVVVWEEWSPFI